MKENDKDFIGLYLEKEVKDELNKIAKKNKRSLSSEVAMIIEKSLKEIKDGEDR
jgi:predicted DNA-binding protein